MLDELRTTPTVKLIYLLDDAEKNGDQKLVNIYAFELACRIYVPNDEITFEKVLNDFGYKKLTKENELKRTK